MFLYLNETRLHNGKEVQSASKTNYEKLKCERGNKEKEQGKAALKRKER